MKYPSIMDASEVGGEDDAENIFAMVKKCVKQVYTTDGDIFEPDQLDAGELDTFINSMNSGQFRKINEFFGSPYESREIPTVVKRLRGESDRKSLKGAQPLHDIDAILSWPIWLQVLLTVVGAIAAYWFVRQFGEDSNLDERVTSLVLRLIQTANSERAEESR